MTIISFDNNKLLAELFGEANSNINYIEAKLKVTLYSKGDILSINGENSTLAKELIEKLYDRLTKGYEINKEDIDFLINTQNLVGIEEHHIKTPKKLITPKNQSQLDYLKLLLSKDIIFASGPAGTGKTYLAIAQAISMLMEGSIDRIILSRPAIEAGESLGYLPGDLKDKIDPYLRPLYDAIEDMMPIGGFTKLIESKQVEIAPLAYMRGRTLGGAFIILDEAQNATTNQMKMFLTRFGYGSKMIINGDPTQCDLPKNSQSGLIDAVDRLSHIEDIGFAKFSESDIVRHKLISKIVKAYENK